MGISGISTLAQLNTAYGLLVDPAAATYTLTTAVDAGASFTAGTGVDSFVATLTTLTTGDSLDGGDGTDTLSLTANITADASIAGFTTVNIENFNVSVTDGAAASADTVTINALNLSATSLQVSGLGSTTAEDTVVFNNVAAGTTVAMANATDLNVTANYVAAATSGTADTVSVSLNAAGSTASGDSDLTVGTGFETINVATTGAASTLNDIVTSSATTMNITGDQNLTVRLGLDETLNVINASAFTGNLSILTVDDTTTPDATVSSVDVADITITGGSGGDTINAVANGADNEISISAGGGDDTVTVGQIMANSSSTSAGDVVAGGDGDDTLAGDVDLFDAGTAGFTGATTLTGVSGFETLKLSGFGAEANTVNVSNISSDITTVEIASATGGNTTVNFADGARTIEVGGAAAILDGDALIADATGSSTDDTLAITNVNAATGTAQMGANDTDITTTDFETVTINTGSYSTATAQLVNAVNIGAANALVLTGSNGLTTTATTGIITAATIDASGMTGVLTMNVAAADGVTTITGGSGNDTLKGDAASTINGGDGDDTIVGGSGNDTLNGGNGNDGITTGAGTDAVDGGAGNDTFTVVGNLTATDTFEGGDGDDTISLSDASLTVLNGLTVSEANTFNAGFNNVEKLTISDELSQASFDIGYLDSINHVTLASTINGVETLNGFDSGDTIELTTTDTDVLTVGVNSAATGTSDVLNVLLTDGTGNAEDFGVIAIANVETINVTTREATADASDSASTLGMNISQATGGAAQTVNFLGTESVVIDTAIAAGTINASGLTISAATDNGLTMNSTVHTAAQTITGSGGVDTLYGSTKADTINGGAGADVIHGGTGADTIDGGADTDTIHTTSMVGGTIEGTGTGTSTGVVINLGSTSVTAATINAATTEFISGSLTSVGAGQSVYLFGAESSLNTSVADTISNVENVTLAGNGINYVVGSDAANVIVGGTGADTILGGAGADTITGGTGVDTLTGGAGDDDFIFTSGLTIDTVTDFVSGTDDAVFSLSALETAGAVISAKTADIIDGDGTSLAAGATMVVLDIAAATTLTQTATVLNYTAATKANAAALETALEAGGGLLTTEATTGVTAADSMLAMYDNGTNIILAMVEFTSTVAAGTQIAAVDVTDIATLTGVTTDLVAGDFGLIA